MQNKPIKKLYYSISDVSKIADVKQHVLRYWENQFDELRPTKNRAGNRIYRLREVKLVFLIKRLLYQEKFTIEGAKKQLKTRLKNDADLDTIKVEAPKDDVKEMVQSLKYDIWELKKIIFSEVGA